MNVWVTRDEQPDGRLCTALRTVGLTPVCEPVLSRRVVNDAADIISALGPDDWLVLTSPYAVKSVAKEPSRVPHVAVVGEPSRVEAELLGFRVELVAESEESASVFRELSERATRGVVCYPRSSLAHPPKPWGHVQVVSPVLYEVASRPFAHSVVDRVDWITVASPSAAEAIDGSIPVRSIRFPFASIGPTTTAALRKLGVAPTVEAPHRSFDALATAIVDHVHSSRHHRA